MVPGHDVESRLVSHSSVPSQGHRDNRAGLLLWLAGPILGKGEEGLQKAGVFWLNEVETWAFGLV